MILIRNICLNILLTHNIIKNNDINVKESIHIMPIDSFPLRRENKESQEYNRKKNIDDFLLIDPQYSFEDMILPINIMSEIKNIIALNKYKELIYDEWGLASVIKNKKNVTINLYGYSGTGKSMTAHAIAHELNQKVLIVNYSEIESKYVGETAKNLVNLFKYAQQNEAVIVFDEADALLSKRVTAMHSATDVSVNQTRNVLLKILDNYQGVIIFTTNFIQNFDQAFMRRILSHIKYEMPDEMVRQKLWEHYLVDRLPLIGKKSDFINELKIIDNVTGSDIATAVLKASVKIAANKENGVTLDSLISEINKIIQAKEEIKQDGFTMTTRKVSEEYVKEKLARGESEKKSEIIE